MTRLHIEVKNLIKEYKGTPAVREVSLHVKKGEIVGLLGPNGAGKTTTFYMIVGIEKPHQEKYLFLILILLDCLLMNVQI